MNATNGHSKYWLSPGVDVPTLAKRPADAHDLRGLYVQMNSGDAMFAPPDDFMRQPPFWRLFVLGGIAASVRQIWLHALVDQFRECQALNPEIPREREIAVFLEWCAESHIDAPEELEALLIQDREFRQSGLL
jgi:hypothetical protein